MPTCPYTPNTYAGGTDDLNGGARWGVSGYSTSYTVSVPENNFYFSDQAVHAITSGDGLEVGWYIGWGAETQTYVTQPHAYATANGPDEIDGPDIGDITDYYNTYWDGQDEAATVMHSGSIVFQAVIPVNTSGPGVIVAVGEINNSTLNMKGYMYRLQHMWSNYDWYDWSGLEPCADPPTSVSDYGSTWFHDQS